MISELIALCCFVQAKLTPCENRRILGVTTGSVTGGHLEQP